MRKVTSVGNYNSKNDEGRKMKCNQMDWRQVFNDIAKTTLLGQEFDVYLFRSMSGYCNNST